MKIIQKFIFSSLFISAISSGPVLSQQLVAPTLPVTTRSFAIVVDQKTYQQCQNDLKAYQSSIEREGLPTFIVVHPWKSPEEVKTQILKLYKENKLEGIALVGDIPIPMIRKAQHLATAFKMDEKYPIKDSSIPSDRYYDDFDLSFDFLERDKTDPQLFYYNLGLHSANSIQSDIYSGRIKAIAVAGKSKYEQISHYLQKVVKAKLEKDPIDNVLAYLGDGTLSNSLIAWTPELYRLEEQFPNTFKNSSQAQVFRFDTWEYPKHEIVNQLKRNDLDIAFIHEHGLTERMYISGDYPTYHLADHHQAIKRGLNSIAKRNVKDEAGREKFLKNYVEKYNLAPSIIAGYASQEYLAEDSIRTFNQGINANEIDAIAPNVRMTIFDACYNGDFRENDYVAGRFIFSEGKSLIALANSVSILQDVNTPHLIGSLGMGLSVGHWAQFNHVLESHIIGDPTFTFTPNSAVSAPEIVYEKDNNKLLNQLKTFASIEAKNLILTQLYWNQYDGLSRLIEEEYDRSNDATTRFTCLQLATQLGGDIQNKLLQKGSIDNDEFIRRHSLNLIAEIGDPFFIPTLIDAYIENQHASRVLFSIKMSLYSFQKDQIRDYAEKAFSNARFTDPIAKKEAFYKDQFQGFYNDIEKEIFDEKSTFRKTAISSLKNVNYHPGLSRFIGLVLDDKTNMDMRIAMLQSLAWFGNSYRKKEIEQACQTIIANPKYASNLKEEAQRTLNTIK